MPVIAFNAFGVRFTLPLFTLIVPFLAAKLGLQGSLGAVFLALGVHELAHIAAAKLLRVHIREIRLMPFGGSARMENPYRLSPGKLIPVATAGPAANLLLAVSLAALAHWRLLLPADAAACIQPNLLLLLFNLLPALPLDGGRILFALLEGPLGERRALLTGIWIGRILSILLLALAIAGGLRNGKWNLTLVLAAIFILASERDERSALAKSHAQRYCDLLADRSDPHPAHVYQADEATTARNALNILRPREDAWFVLTRGSVPTGLIDSRSILNHLIQNNAPDAALEEIPGYRLLPGSASGA